MDIDEVQGADFDRMRVQEDVVLIPMDPQPEKPILGVPYIWEFERDKGKWIALESCRCAGIWTCPMGKPGDKVKRFGRKPERIEGVSVAMTEYPESKYFWSIRLKEHWG